MKTVIYAIAFIGLAQCAKLDHLKYLPPDSRSPNKESFDQGLAAPNTAQTQGSSGSEPQRQPSSFGQARSFEPQPTPTGSFNAGSQNAARLQGAPFIPKTSSGTFGSSGPVFQQNQGFAVGQQDLNKPATSNEPSGASSTFGSTNQVSQPNSGPQKSNQQQGFSQKPLSQSTNQFQGPSAFGSTNQAGSGPQPTNQPHKTYGVPDSQSDVSDGAQSARPYGASQGSTFGQPGLSSTFPGTPGSGPGLSHGSSFAQNGPAINNFNSQTSAGTFGSGPQQTSGSYDSSSPGKNITPAGSYSSSVQPSQTFGGQSQEVQSSRSFDAPSGSSNQAPEPFGISKSTASFNAPSTFSQSKYQPSSQNQIPIIRLDTKNYGDGTYSTAYETGNGIKAEEQGQTQGDNSIAQGSFSYTSPEGEKVGITYTADEDGYHPQGEHLPTPPPVPEAILKSLEYNKAHPEEENDDGSYKDTDAPESSGQYTSPFGKTQYPGSSNKYLAPTSGAKSQFFGGPSTSLARGSPTLENSRSFPSQKSSSNQDSFPSSTNDEPQGDSSTPFARGGPTSESSFLSRGPSSNQATFPSSSSDGPQGSSLARGGPTPVTSFPTHGSTSNQATFPSSSYSSSANDRPQGGSSTTFARGGPTAGNSFPVHGSSSSSSPSYSSSENGEPRSDDSISVSAPASSNYGGQSSQPGDNKQTSSSSGYQYKAPSSFGSASNAPTASSNRAFPSSSFGNFQAASVNQPTQKPNYSGFNSPLSSQPGFKSVNVFQESSNAPQTSPTGHFGSQDSVVDSSSPQGRAESYGAPGPSSSSSNVPSNQFSSHQSFSGPVTGRVSQAGRSFGSSFPGTSQGIASSQQNYQNTNNGPIKSSGTPQDSGNTRFGPESVGNQNKQVTSGFTRPQGQQNSQASYSSGPTATKSTQFSGYQYNAPNTPFGGSGSSNLQQAGNSQAKAFPSGTSQGPEGSSNTPFGSPGSSNFPRPIVSEAKSFPSGNNQQGSSNNTPFGNQGSLSFSQPKAFPSGNTQGTDSSSTSKFGPGSGSSKIVGEFGPGEFRSNSGPVRTPGVQAQDENGGYLY